MTETPEEKICTSEKVLLRDLKLMRHRQVIHPVLQEGKAASDWTSTTSPPAAPSHFVSVCLQVGLKLNLLDPTLAIDLRYLGVRLPIPPPGEAPPLGQTPGIVPHSSLRTSCPPPTLLTSVVSHLSQPARSVLRLCIPNRQNHRRDSDQRLEGKIHGTRNSAHIGTALF